MIMIEKKDPNQKKIKDDFPDDDPIIELTDEVIIKPAEDRKAASPRTDDFIPPKVDKEAPTGDDEGFIVFEEKAKSILQNDPFTEAHGQIDNDALERSGDDTQNNFDEEIEIDFFSGDDEMAEDIIEITEFDRHFPDDDEVIKNAGLLDPSGLDNGDFIELFDIEEEDPMEDEKMRELSEAEEKAVEAELSRFFDDTLEDETTIENNAPQPFEKNSELDSDLDLAMTAAALSSGPGKFDRPDTPFPQDPTDKKERTSLPKDQSEKEDPMQKDSPAYVAGDSPVVSPEQIDQAIERIIKEKLAGRIEHIIYEIIEKTVKREIDRLKASLLEDSTPEDDL
jgi:hypothetical protein